MRIRYFKFHDPAIEGWELDPVSFNPHINLLVGESGSGKTRLLNMLFNVAAFVATNQRFCGGTWKIQFEHHGVEYTWEYSGLVDEDGKGRVMYEKFWIGDLIEVKKVLVERDQDITKFDGVTVPKIPTSVASLNAYREDDKLKAPFDAFTKIMRRNFFGEDLSHAISMQSTPHLVIRKIIKSKEIGDLFGTVLTLNTLMFILEKYFPKKFKAIVEQFRAIFPKIESMYTKSAGEHFGIQDVGNASILILKEYGIKSPIPLTEISSGMQKVLLILADVIVAPKGTLYLIDEYENSLGINAINFLPGFLTEFGGGRQFMLTTHHPMLINAIPLSSWFVFHREGVHITVKYGSELEERYGKSKQQRFTQLLNDPFYSGGVN